MFLKKALNTISETGWEQYPKVFLTVNTAKIRIHENSQILRTIKFQDFVKYFCGILISQNIMCFEKYCERISWKYILERLLLTSKSFLSFWKYLVTRVYWVEIYGKVLHVFKTVCNGKRLFLLIDFIFLKPKFFFSWSNILYTVSLRKLHKCFWSSVFTKIKECELQLRKEKTEPLGVWLRAFTIGIVGLHCTLQ